MKNVIYIFIIICCAGYLFGKPLISNYTNENIGINFFKKEKLNDENMDKFTEKLDDEDTDDFIDELDSENIDDFVDELNDEDIDDDYIFDDEYTEIEEIDRDVDNSKKFRYSKVLKVAEKYFGVNDNDVLYYEIDDDNDGYEVQFGTNHMKYKVKLDHNLSVYSSKKQSKYKNYNPRISRKQAEQIFYNQIDGEVDIFEVDISTSNNDLVYKIKGYLDYCEYKAKISASTGKLYYSEIDD